MDDEESVVEETDNEVSNLLDDLNSQFGKGGGQSGFDTYSQETQKFGYIPENQFAHAYMLLTSQSKSFEKDGMDIVDDPQIMLGNIENEKTMRYYQRDLFYLIQMCGIAIYDETFQEIFKPLWKVFKSEVRITSAMGGTERQYQAFHIPQASHKKGFSLFGKTKKKKKKEPRDYIFPEEDEETMY